MRLRCIKIRNVANTMKYTRCLCTNVKQNKIRLCKWKPMIGLEIHAQVSSISKLFSRVGINYHAAPNTQVGVFECAHPGTLPVLNKRCVEAAIKTALALGATVNRTSWFDRKHYFYPDLPAGYQITQHSHPIAINGRLDFVVYNAAVHKDPYFHSSDLIQIQLEEDSGKSLHDENNHRVLVDLNRAGQPLMELVFTPSLSNGEEAAALVKELIGILKGIGSCNCRMEEGSLRIDANISVSSEGEPFGTRTEVKNINSLRSVVKAVEFEVDRQISVLESGGKVVNETRRFDAILGKTVSMRDKEEVQDYRFLPEPNLPPLRLFDSSVGEEPVNGCIDIHSIRVQLPTELPADTRQRLMAYYGLSLKYAILLMNDEAVLHYFEQVMKCADLDAKDVCTSILIMLLGSLNKKEIHISESPVSPLYMSKLMALLEEKKIMKDAIEKVLNFVVLNDDERSPMEIVDANNWTILPDEKIAELCDKILLENPKLVAKCKMGKIKAFSFLANALHKSTSQSINMKLAVVILRQKLGIKDQRLNSVIGTPCSSFSKQ